MPFMQNYSLRSQILVWTGLLVSLVFIAVSGFTSANFSSQLEESAYHDIETKNKGYVQTIYSIFDAKADAILSLRDDLELYDTRGQMWIHLAAHAGEKIFDDTHYRDVYTEAFEKKLAAYQQSDELSADRMTPQMRKLLANIRTNVNAFGDGMKFFYIGVSAPNQDKKRQEYDEYQDSSLWVPDERVDMPYNPLVRPWYLAGQKASRDDVVFTEPYAERRTKEAVAAGATQIEIDGVIGSLAAGISIEPIMEAFLQIFHDNAHITIFSKGVEHATQFVAIEPKYVYSSRDLSLGQSFRKYNDPEIILIQSNADLMNLYDATRGSDSGVLQWQIDGEDRLVAYDTVPRVGWKVFSSVSKQEMMAGAVAMRYQNMLISFTGLLLLLGIIFFVIKKALAPIVRIGREVDELAATGDLNKRATVSRTDEVGKMAISINEMLDNTAGPIKLLGEQVQRIAGGDLSVDIDIPAKGDVADLIDAFNIMAQKLIELEQNMRDASPLTGLPGGLTIEKMVQTHIEQNTEFAFCMFDADNFKPFNDRYGYSRGNLVIKHTAKLIEQAIGEHSASSNRFVGHVGGDDFVVICEPDYYQQICEQVIQAFDKTIADFYDEQDKQAGGILSKDRQGKERKFDIMSISVCAVNSQAHQFTDYLQVGEIIAELKRYSKTLKGSNLVLEKRNIDTI